MKNSQIVRDIISTLEKEHINLYHDISKEEIEKRIAKIKNIDDLSDLEFDYEMSKLFALFKDAHTSYIIPKTGIDHAIRFLKDKFYIWQNNEWEEIKTIGGQDTEKVFQKIKEIANFETQEWLSVIMNDRIQNFYVWQMLGLKHFVETQSGKKIDIDLLKQTQTKPDRTFKLSTTIYCM